MDREIQFLGVVQQAAKEDQIEHSKWLNNLKKPFFHQLDRQSRGNSLSGYAQAIDKINCLKSCAVKKTIQLNVLYEHFLVNLSY